MKKIYTIFVCICLLAGFVACEKDKDFVLTTLMVQNETITPSYGSATIDCSFKADATISEAFVQYTLSSSFAKYDVAKMTEEKGKYVAQLTDLQDNTTYYIRYAVSNKYSSAVTEEVMEFQTLQCTAPTIALDSIVDVWDNRAKAYLHLAFDGGASVTDMGICWGTQTNPTTKDIHVSTEDTLAVLDITSLQSNTRYYVRAYAMNKVGVAYSEEKVFTTLALPEVRTEDVSDIQVNSALLSATLVFDGNDTATIKGFCWSEKSEPTIEGDHIAIDTASAGYTYLLTALLPETQYFVRAYAQNKIGVVYGEEKTFTTTKEIMSPTVTTAAITQITETTAVAGGNVTSDGGAEITERGVVYATTQNPTTNNIKVKSGTGTGLFTCNLTGLQQNTTYYVRAYAINEKGTAYGEGVKFITNKQIVLPSVTTATVTQITETTAVAGGNVTSDGGAEITERGVVYATTQNPTTNNIKVKSGTGTGSFTCNLTGLQPNTKYYVRAYAINSKSTAYGEEVTFTTNKQIVLPSVITATVTQITGTTALVGGNVTSDGGASVTERGVVYATTQNPTTNNTKVMSGTGTGSFTCNLTGLQQNTTYYVRAYAMNSKGTAYGEEVTFTTLVPIVLPTLTTSSVTQITETSAVAGGNVTSDGGASVTERGVVYSINQNPTTADNKIPNGSGMGSFTCNLTSLQPNTTYYVRAYAVNSKGTAYGEEVSFTTKEQSSIPSNDTENGHEYVDLGLSVKWATCNVGASYPEDYGDYYKWYTSFSSSDIANETLGGKWRTPTKIEFNELIDNSIWTWSSSKKGYIVTSKKNEKTIFLPAAGFDEGEKGKSGYYWSSTLNTTSPQNAYALYFTAANVEIMYLSYHYYYSIRPVCP